MKNTEKISKEKIKEIIHQVLRKQMFDGNEFDNIIKDKQDNNIYLYDDLEFDSLDATEIILLVEHELAAYNVSFDIDIIDHNTTIQNIIDYTYKIANNY